MAYQQIPVLERDAESKKSKDKGCSIYNIPKKLRKVNKEAYTPQVVSIGPLHRAQPHLQAMRLTKTKFCQRFCNRTHVPDIDSYIKEAKKWEKEARSCYEEKFSMESDKFLEMMVVDGIFVIEVLLWVSTPAAQGSIKKDDDEIFKNELLRTDVLHDMMLVENQLPLFVLEKLYNLINSNTEWGDILFAFAATYFKKAADVIQSDWVVQALRNGRHLVDFYHIISVFANPSVNIAGSVVLKFVRTATDTSDRKLFELSRSAKELHAAGVEFKRRNFMLPFDLDFKVADGDLLIPALTINRWTESFFLNMIAYEHCIRKEKIITSFVVLMANLIKEPDDVEILVNNGIIKNTTLGNNQDVFNLFHGFYDKSMMNKTEFFYADLCKDLNEYSRDSYHVLKLKWYNWTQVLKKDYFSSPWAIISLVGAIFLLILDVIQTVSGVKGGKLF